MERREIKESRERSETSLLCIGFPAQLVNDGGFQMLYLAQRLKELGYRIRCIAPVAISNVPTYQIAHYPLAWRPSISTVQKPRAVKFAVNLVRSVINYPDSCKGWLKQALAVGDAILNPESFWHEPIDTIISFHPITCHIIASRLKEKYPEVRWLACLTDLWSQNHHYPYNTVRKMIDRHSEVIALDRADIITTVSPEWAQKLKDLHPQKRVIDLPHGFASQNITANAEIDKKFSILYTGTIYPDCQQPEILLAALANLIQSGDIKKEDVQTRFIGSHLNKVRTQILDYRLESIVSCEPPLSHDVILQQQRKAQMLLLMDWADVKERGVLTYKLYEYLTALRPILATGGSHNNAIERMSRNVSSMTHCCTVEETKETLRKWYTEFKLTGKVTCERTLEEITPFSREAVVNKLDRLLRHLL